MKNSSTLPDKPFSGTKSLQCEHCLKSFGVGGRPYISSMGFNHNMCNSFGFFYQSGIHLQINYAKELH